MVMIKLKNILLEAPIDTYQPIGDFDKAASFRDKRDRDLVVHPVAIQKVKDFFKNTTTDFDFYFVNLKGRKRFAERGEVSSNFVFNKYPDGLGIEPTQLKDGKINENNITVFFVGNTAAEKIPMTAWTIAHRFGHSLNRTYGFKVYSEWLDEQFNNILKEYGVEDGNRTYFNKAICNLFNQIGTMRSARQGEIKRYFEFYYELFAQYLKDGEIQFNKLNNSIITGSAAYGGKNYSRRISDEVLQNINNDLDAIKRDFKYYAEDVLGNCSGKIYVM